MADDLNVVAIKRLAEKTGRICGSCTMCCYVLKVEDPELAKPADQWCKHCNSSGCGIYETRPGKCRGFGWGWLTGMEDFWRPEDSKIVPHMKGTEEQVLNLSGGPEELKLVLWFEAYDKYSGRWRQQPYYESIR